MEKWSSAPQTKAQVCECVCRDPGLVPEEVLEVLAAAREDDLVGAEDLALADEGDVHILARAQVLAQRREHSAPLLSLEAADNIRSGVNHLCAVSNHFSLDSISEKPS